MLQHVRGFLTNQPVGVRLPNVNSTKQERAEYKKAWYEKNKSRILAEQRQQRIDNAEKYKAARTARSKQRAATTKLWRDNLPPDRRSKLLAENNQRAQLWKKENPERKSVLDKAATHRRRARIAQASGAHTADDIQELLTLQRSSCATCRKALLKSYHVDHIEPLAKGGSNGKTNLQILCPTCNLKKGCRDPLEFMQSRGFLL